MGLIKVKAIIMHKNKLLLIYIPKKNVFDLPGGGVENNEKNEVALCREIKEETGYSVKKILSKFKELIDDNDNTIHVYECLINTRKDNVNLTEIEKNENIVAKWCSIDNAIKINEDYIAKNIDKDVFREKRTLLIIKEYKEKILTTASS